MNARRLYLVSLASISLIVLTIVIGGLVKAHGAGLACGTDWPHCNGVLIPDLTDTGVLLEYMHRVVGGLAYLSIVYIALTLLRHGEKGLASLALASLAAITIQVLLGMAVVRSLLDQYLVAAHLSMAMVSLVGATILTVLLRVRVVRGCKG
ncbi:MAG: COX15/CtaA family protein [Desulfurococcales archaeon]|nr:COX15/CtaA family protein [Desulfurococcales archaeon]MCE4605181.1 COX15/CtaA family protein [Desulfurococcales archaeon]